MLSCLEYSLGFVYSLISIDLKALILRLLVLFRELNVPQLLFF